MCLISVSQFFVWLLCLISLWKGDGGGRGRGRKRKGKWWVLEGEEQKKQGITPQTDSAFLFLFPLPYGFYFSLVCQSCKNVFLLLQLMLESNIPHGYMFIKNKILHFQCECDKFFYSYLSSFFPFR